MSPRRPRLRRPAPPPGSTTTSLYWPGSSWLHRMPAGVKLLALLAGATAVVVANRPAVSAAVLVGLVAVIRSTGVPWREIARRGRPILFVVVLLAVFQALIGRPVEGMVAGVRLLAVAALALAVTLTTSATQIVDWLERTLRRLRVRPARVFRIGLVIGLALRSLDHLGVVVHRVLDARRARGLHRNLRAFAVPTIVAAARFAHGAGEALEARGIARPVEEPGLSGGDPE
jgi:biotin transport system permease protein